MYQKLQTLKHIKFGLFILISKWLLPIYLNISAYIFYYSGLEWSEADRNTSADGISSDNSWRVSKTTEIWWLFCVLLITWQKKHRCKFHWTYTDRWHWWFFLPKNIFYCILHPNVTLKFVFTMKTSWLSFVDRT